MQQHLRATADIAPLVKDVARILRDKSPSRARQKAVGQGATDTLPAAVAPDQRVLHGPFEGLLLAAPGNWGGIAARVAGTYECEIASSVLERCGATPSAVFDVGSAEGYYAAGIGRLLPETPVLAFEIDPDARRACRENARLNGLSNVRCIGRATPQRLESHLRPHSLVLSDCEGFEMTLLDPERAPTLRTCDVIVELHEFAVPGVTAEIRRRFSSTHRIRIIGAEARQAADWPHLRHLPAATVEVAIDEGRPSEPRMAWAVLVSDGRVRAEGNA